MSAPKSAPDWRIYYSDDVSIWAYDSNGVLRAVAFDGTYTEISKSAGGPKHAPLFGVMCIVYPDDMVGRQIMNGWDNYFWNDHRQQWWGCNDNAVRDRLINDLPIRHLREGRSVSNKMWALVMKLAGSDPDFPAKSGVMRSESPMPAPGAP